MKKKIRTGLALFGIYIASMFTCCAPVRNVPIELPPIQNEQEQMRYEDTVKTLAGNDSLMIIMTFSGGGTAAMRQSYEVVQALRSNGLKKEIDYISSVSGGSFTAAAASVFNDSEWVAFDTIINRNMQRDILWKYKPWRWALCPSPFYSRTDNAAHYYNETIFNRKTLSDAHYPTLFINSTVLARGCHFIYKKSYFEMLGSAFETYPIAAAVTASSAFPGAFSPLSMMNYGDSISYDSMENDSRYMGALMNAEFDVTAYRKMKLIKFLNNKENTHIWTADGGLSGNLGLRPILDGFKSNGFINKWLNSGKAQTLVVIVVDAARDPVDRSDMSSRAPNVVDMLGYSTVTAMEMLSSVMIEELDDKLDELWKSIAKAHWDISDPLHGMTKPIYIEVSSRQMTDEVLKEKYMNVPTALYLDSMNQNTIKKMVKNVLDNSKSYQKLIDIQ